MKTLDDGLAEAISSIIWVAPRLQADVQEIKIVADQLGSKYGKPYALACRENSVGTVSEKLMHKLSVQAPPKLTVEKYMVEIAKYYNVEYTPDPQVMDGGEQYAADALIDLGPAPPLPDKNDLGGAGGGGGGGEGGASGGGGGGGVAAAAAAPPHVPFNYPNLSGAAGAAAPYPYPPAGAGAGGGFNIPPAGGMEDAPPAYFPPDMEKPPLAPGVDPQPPPPVQRHDSVEDNTARGGAAAAAAGGGGGGGSADFPELPGVPDDAPVQGGSDDDEVKKGGGGGDDDEEIDFDDLTKRFEALKKKR